VWFYFRLGMSTIYYNIVNKHVRLRYIHYLVYTRIGSKVFGFFLLRQKYKYDNNIMYIILEYYNAIKGLFTVGVLIRLSL